MPAVCCRGPLPAIMRMYHHDCNLKTGLGRDLSISNSVSGNSQIADLVLCALNNVTRRARHVLSAFGDL